MSDCDVGKMERMGDMPDEFKPANVSDSPEFSGYMTYRVEKKLFKMRERLAGVDEKHHPKLKEFYRNEVRKIEDRYTGI